MDIEKTKAIIEAILFAAGRVVKINELVLVLEKNEELDFIILSSILPGELELKELIKKIIEINKKIKIILICESKDEELEKYLYNKGVYKIIYVALNLCTLCFVCIINKNNSCYNSYYENSYDKDIRF